MYLIINRKSYPWHSDGGTCITTYEQSLEIAKENDVIIAVVSPHFNGKRIKKGRADFRCVNIYSLIFLIIRNRKLITEAHIHSAFQAYGLIASVTLFVQDIPFTYSSHGSFDKLIFCFHRFIRFLFFDFLPLRLASSYTLNSHGELSNMHWLPKQILTKFCILPNTPPLHLLSDILERNHIKTIEDIPPPNLSSLEITDKPYLLYIGRITPKKRLFETLDAFINSSLPEKYNFIICRVNDDDKYLRNCRELAESSKKSSTIFFVGAVFGLQKFSFIRYATYSLLLSISEGSPIFIQESLLCSTPVIVTPYCNVPPSDFVIHVSSPSMLCEVIS